MFVVKNLIEYDLVKKNKNKIYIENFILYLQLKKKTNVEYFYSPLSKIKNSFEQDFFLNWFKSDYTKKSKNIDFLQCFSRTFLYETLQYLKLRIVLNSLLNKEKNKIFFFEDNSDFVKNLKLFISFNSKLKKKIKFLKIINENSKKINKRQILRGQILDLNYKFYFSLLPVIFQGLFLKSRIKNKILYFKDWSSIEYFLNSKQLLISNIKNIFRSFYIYKNPFDNNNYKNLIKQISNFRLNKNIIKKIFKKNKINYDDNIFNLLSFLIKRIINKENNLIKKYLNIYSNLIKFYNPKGIIIPDGSSFHNLLLFYLAKKNNTKVILCVDGYQCFSDYHGLVYDQYQKDTLFDYILCPGESYKKLMLNHGIDKSKLITIFPPIINNININKNYFYKKFDAVILGYIPFSRNLNCNYESYILTELEIIKALKSIGKKNIAIKIKGGNKIMLSMQKREIASYEKIFELIFKEKFDVNLTFETGKLSETIKYSELVVGSFSTAFFESLYQDKPYYIYEPVRNGLTKKQLNLNEICNKKFISRDYHHLKKNLLLKNFFSVEKKFFNGVNIEKLDNFFKKL